MQATTLNEYHVLFDVSRQGYVAWREAEVPMVVCAMALLLVLVLRFPVQHQSPELKRYRGFVGLAAVLAALVSLGILGFTWKEHELLTDALEGNEFTLVTGSIYGLVAEERDGHPRESFSVAGHRYEYSSSDITSAYHWTVGKGGPLRNGLQVRIADVKGMIARIEAR